MKKSHWLILSALAILVAFGWAKMSKSSANPYALKDGDIVFQETKGGQASAIKAATNSRWTHVGIVFFEDGKPMVLEAVQPVQIVPLKTFIARSPKTFYAMRLKDFDKEVTRKEINKAKIYGKSMVGKNYDSLFLWSDDRIYCSELVWKIYKKSAGVEICKPRQFRSYNLEHPTVQRIIKQRYGSIKNVPLDELAVAPSDLAESKLLIECPRVEHGKKHN